jgi:hypothetical protein
MLPNAALQLLESAPAGLPSSRFEHLDGDSACSGSGDCIREESDIDRIDNSSRDKLPGAAPDAIRPRFMIAFAA